MSVEIHRKFTFLKIFCISSLALMIDRLSSFSYKIHCNEVLHLIYWFHTGFDTWPVKRKVSLRSVCDGIMEQARFK